ncbi:hypothetical protein GCM10010211_73400 [Streptomyces albospinus]|uniref:Uncharacterized protein n=1 Tax=Streptomyces albospinus TaxID=285515 RepID=A0ABQ2VL11_9ACTN|nr:hypothetical protein [Streptomyces albospinus]GGU95589.1 hypothetical protein GCM10010211_73400 [Streptomyces albospinus]
MRSPQLTLCAAVAACAVTTAPAYVDDERGTGTAQVAVAPAPVTPGAAGTPRLTGCAAERATARPAAPTGAAPTGAAPRTRTAVHPAPAGCPGTAATAARPALAPAATPAHPVEGPATVPSAQPAAPHRELSSTSAVALVLAGGAILVIAGQLLRLRLRLRRERQGSSGGDE